MTDETQKPLEENESEIDILKRVRRLMLLQWEKALLEGNLSSTDAATITRLASQNGWVLDETRLPSRLKDKMTTQHNPRELDQDDGVIPIRKAK